MRPNIAKKTGTDSIDLLMSFVVSTTTVKRHARVFFVSDILVVDAPAHRVVFVLRSGLSASAL